MKIAFLLSSVSQAGGMERVCIKIANELSDKYQVSIISLHGPEKPFFDIKEDVNLFYLYPSSISFRKKFLSRTLKLRKILKKEKVDCLIDVDSYLSFMSVPATLGLKIKTIAWEHFNCSVTFSRKSRTFARKLAASKDKVVTLTTKDQEYYEKLTGRNNIITIANPVPFDLPVVPSKIEDKVVLAVGRLNKQKGFDMLLHAWSLISHNIPEWKLKIVGGGEFEDELLLLRNQLKLNKSVEFVGRTDNVEKYYQSSSLLVMSSRFEGLPMVLIESKFYGLPQVSFDCETGPSDIIEDGKDGYLVEPGNIEMLAEKIEYIIKNNKLIEFSENALKNCSRFKIESILKLWISLLENSEKKNG